jgi:hypothetical protein
MQNPDPVSAQTASQRRRIAVTVIMLALVALAFFVSAFFKPWQ